jgi:hypothetical protein
MQPKNVNSQSWHLYLDTVESVGHIVYSKKQKTQLNERSLRMCVNETHYRCACGIIMPLFKGNSRLKQKTSKDAGTLRMANTADGAHQT